MKPEQKLWITCLDSTDKAEDFERALREHKQKRKEAYSKLYHIYNGKDVAELRVIWKKNFDKITEDYYRDEVRFPDANKMLSNRNVAWRSRATSKRRHFINRMLGIKVRHGVVNDKASNDALVSRLDELSHEIIVRHNDLKAAQMRNILKSYEKVLNIFSKFHKDEIKADY